VSHAAAPLRVSWTVYVAASRLLTAPLCVCVLQNTEAEAHQQLSYAFDYGLNFMDSAGGCRQF
jgi:aryl-alcohol dehydrogenase-like predicted oxidoreductase